MHSDFFYIPTCHHSLHWGFWSAASMILAGQLPVLLARSIPAMRCKPQTESLSCTECPTKEEVSWFRLERLQVKVKSAVIQCNSHRLCLRNLTCTNDVLEKTTSLKYRNSVILCRVCFFYFHVMVCKRSTCFTSTEKIQVVGAVMTWRSPVLMVILQMHVQHYLICMSGIWDWKGVRGWERVERSGNFPGKLRVGWAVSDPFK